jgi:Recombination endonuclease VII
MPRCAICNQEERKVTRGKVVMLAVDHDHATGKVRGLLCHTCNVALGLLQDSPGLLANALSYVRHHSLS